VCACVTVVAGTVGAHCGDANLTHCGPFMMPFRQVQFVPVLHAFSLARIEFDTDAQTTLLCLLDKVIRDAKGMYNVFRKTPNYCRA